MIVPDDMTTPEGWPYRQTILHDDPDGRPGDCLRAAVATLVMLDWKDVPHFLMGNPAGVEHGDMTDSLWWFAMEGWAAWLQPPQRWVRIEQDRRNPQIPERPCIVTGKSPRGDFCHAMVYFGDGDWWDPHPSGDCIDDVQHVEWLEPVE